MCSPKCHSTNGLDCITSPSHGAVRPPAFFNPLFGRLLLEVGKKEAKPFNVLSRPSPGILDIPNNKLFHVPIIKAYK